MRGRIAGALAPSHASMVFQPFLRRSPLLSGSRGFGICFSEGVITRVEIVPSESTKVFVYLNGIESSAETSREVVSFFLDYLKEPSIIRIHHETNLPIAAGFGLSGAGALSLSLALNEALSAGLTYEECSRIAHRAEVRMRTGLGDVPAQTAGGFVLRLREGPLGIGEIEKLPIPEDIFFLYKSLGGRIETRERLSKEAFLKRAGMLGKIAIREFLKDKSLENAIRISRWFSMNLLMDPVLENELSKLEELFEIGVFLALLGRTIVGVTRDPEKILDMEEGFKLLRVSERGAKVVDVENSEEPPEV